MQGEHIYVRSSEADSVQFCSTEWIRRDVRCCLLAVSAFKSWLFKISHALNMLSIIHIHMRNPNSSPLSDVLCSPVLEFPVEPPHTHIALTPRAHCRAAVCLVHIISDFHNIPALSAVNLYSTRQRACSSRLMKYEYEVGPPKTHLYTREIWASWRATRMFKTQNTCHPTAPSSCSL